MIHLGDITKINGAEAPVVNVIIGGSPCQDLSVAGKRVGLAGERSGLFMEQLRIIKEMRAEDEARGRTDEHIRPRFMVWENVPGAFSSNGGADFGAVLQETVKVACRKAPPCSYVWKQMVDKRVSYRRGRKMERCVASIRCAVLGSTPASSQNRTCRRFWRTRRTRNTL